MNSGEGASGKLTHPGKTFFEELAADSLRDFNAQRDKSELFYARIAMIRTGMSLNASVFWKEQQLFSFLQAIIAKHHNHFNDVPIA